MITTERLSQAIEMLRFYEAEEEVVQFIEKACKVIHFVPANTSVSEHINSYERSMIIIESVCEFFGMDRATIFNKGQTKEVVKVRRFIFHLMKLHTTLTLKCIGKTFGKDHATVISAIGKQEWFIQKYKATKEEFEQLNQIVINNLKPNENETETNI